MQYDFAYIESLQAAARQQRAEAVHRLILAPITRFFAHHAARPEVARMAGCSSRTS
jgi:hypothetical protein